jgi:hypothetical protein
MQRALMHQLAEIYGVPSESFGEDPFRRISFFKHARAHVPEVTLSKFLRGVSANRAASASRLSFLPLRGQQPAQTPAPRPARPANGISRGWEKIAPKPKPPVVADAWSDDEDEQAAPATAAPAASVHTTDDDEEEKRPVPTIHPVVMDVTFDDDDDAK